MSRQLVEDFYLRAPMTCIFVGKSMSYKTQTLQHLMENFTHTVPDTTPAKLILIYECWQPAYDAMIAAIGPRASVETYNGFPADAYENPHFFDSPGLCILIVDDQHYKFNNSKVAELLKRITTVYVHHKNLCFFLLCHELYSSSSRILTILRRNANYIWLFQNTPQQLLVNLERDLYGTSNGLLHKVANYVYRYCGSKYLCVDINSENKLKCGLLAGEQPWMFLVDQ